MTAPRRGPRQRGRGRHTLVLERLVRLRFLHRRSGLLSLGHDTYLLDRKLPPLGRPKRSLDGPAAVFRPLCAGRHVTQRHPLHLRHGCLRLITVEPVGLRSPAVDFLRRQSMGLGGWTGRGGTRSQPGSGSTGEASWTSAARNWAAWPGSARCDPPRPGQGEPHTAGTSMGPGGAAVCHDVRPRSVRLIGHRTRGQRVGQEVTRSSFFTWVTPRVFHAAYSAWRRSACDGTFPRRVSSGPLMSTLICLGSSWV